MSPVELCLNFLVSVINEVDQTIMSFGDDEIESNTAVYTLAVSGHVVQAQRDASTVTTVGLLATVLLGFRYDDLYTFLQASLEFTKIRFTGLCALVTKM